LLFSLQKLSYLPRVLAGPAIRSGAAVADEHPNLRHVHRIDDLRMGAGRNLEVAHDLMVDSLSGATGRTTIRHVIDHGCAGAN
jgi:hypothetical protein